jgi:hypothetical protein
LGALGGSLGAPWKSWGGIPDYQGITGAVLGALGCSLGTLGAPWELLGAPWEALGAPWDAFGTPWGKKALPNTIEI